MPPKAVEIALTVRTISSGSLVFRQIGKGIDAGEFLEEHRLAFHHRHRRSRTNVSEPEHRCAVSNDRDTVLLDRQGKYFFRILVNRFADARDTGRVGHREISARFQRQLGDHFDLAADVHQEGAIGDVNNLDAFNVIDGLDDLLSVLAGDGVDGDVADYEIVGDADDVNRTNVSAGAANRGGQLRRVCRRDSKA